MSRTDTDRREAEASRILTELADRMEHVGIRLPSLIGHIDSYNERVTALRGAADYVRKWGERLK